MEHRVRATRAALSSAERCHQQLFDLSTDPAELVDLTEQDRDPTRPIAMVDQITDALIDADDLCRPEPTHT